VTGITPTYLSFHFFSLFLYLILFLARSFDDNRTASWQYVFTVANPSILFSLLVMCLPAGWLLSRISLEERSPSLLLFGASFAISALFWSEPEVIVDASRYFAEAKYLEVYGVGFSSGNGEGLSLYGQTCRWCPFFTD